MATGKPSLRKMHAGLPDDGVEVLPARVNGSAPAALGANQLTDPSPALTLCTGASPGAAHRKAKTMRTAILMPLAAITLLAGCAHHMAHHGPGAGPGAKATLEPTRGHAARGMVMFHQQPDGVFIHARVSGLKPGQSHGFHIHEKGDCASGDGMGTGGHFNPTGKPHGPQDADRHAGDLPALQADGNGQADLRVLLKGLTIGSGATDIVGRGLIVHADPDDYRTQPTGNSGARIACAVIGPMR
jgi:superoxide dismutase, Cu-Zn family